MKNNKSYICLGFALMFSLFACTNSTKKMSNNDAGKMLNNVLDRYYEERLSYFPLEATGIGDNRFNDKLTIDISENFREQLRMFYTKYQSAIDSIQPEGLNQQDLLSYEIFKREMRIQIEGLQFNDYLMPINQFWGMHLTFPLLGSGSGNQPFKTVKDYDNFLKRITAFTAYEDTAIVNMQKGMKIGVVQPKVIIERVLPQLTTIIVKDPKESVFYGPIKNMPASFTVEERERLTKAYEKAIMSEVVPTYQKLYDFLSKEYLPVCRTSSGISDVPTGKELYAYLCRSWNTTEMTPDQIFETGKQEVDRILKEMERIKDETGFKGDMKAFFNFIHTNKQFFPYKNADEVIAAYQDVHTRMEPQLKQLFSLVPKTKFEIRRTEAFREASSSAEYQQGSADGSRPGIFYVPVPDASKYSSVGTEDLFLHEAIPGHHYQMSLQQEDTLLPKFRRFGWYGAYGEGWALYTESLGKELGLYKDPYQYFASLSEEMHRAIRLVVDVGMHTKGWSREQAIEYSLDKDAESVGDITVEIERYMAIPGQATAYKIGQLKIFELRHKAEKTLGDKFSIRAFHDEVLKDGCLPLDIFEKKMDEWVEKVKDAK